MAQDDVKYSQLDNATQLNLVRNRIRELETSHLQISMRVESPAPGEVVTQQDRDNLQQLNNSLADLHKREANLSK